MEKNMSNVREELEALVAEDGEALEVHEGETSFGENGLVLPKRPYTEQERKVVWETWAE